MSTKLLARLVALLGTSLALPRSVPRRAAGRAPPPPQTAKAAAPIDLTGYWVSVVTEDWRYRMVTPARATTRACR